MSADNAFVQEVERQHLISAPIRATYTGVRVQIALLEDEIKEVRDAWQQERCKCPTPDCGDSTWEQTRAEALQVAALAFRLVQALVERADTPKEAASIIAAHYKPGTAQTVEEP